MSDRGCRYRKFCIYCICCFDIFSLNVRHMKKNTHHLHAGEAVTTILLAIGFLGLVMFLSFLFITGNH